MSSPAPYEGKLCCAICGDAIPPPASELSEVEKWQAEAVLLSDPNREFELLEEHYRGGKKRDAPRLDAPATREIRKDRAYVIEQDRLRIVAVEGEDTDTDQVEVHSNRSCGREESGEWAATPYYIATHGACLEVAETAMRRSPHDIAVRDLRTLWKVLRMRFKVDDTYLMSSTVDFVASPQRIQLPHSYYMPFRLAPIVSSTSPNQFHEKCERWEAAYPLNVPDVTWAILDNLRCLPPAAAAIPQAIYFQKKFLSLPPELRDHVCSFLASRNGMPGICNGLLPQWVWREVLLRGECLPFLRDLDVTVIRDFCARWGRERGDCEPNWELLVRKLSQEAWSIWDAETSSLKVPNGLRNRRRIWQLVEEMYVGDLVPVKRVTLVGSDHVAVPRYWDEWGELMHPVVRVHVGSRDKLRSIIV